MNDVWRDRVRGILIVAISSFVLFALLGYPMGVVGSLVRESLRMIFGNGIYVLLAFMILYGYYRIRGYAIENVVLIWLGIAFMTVSGMIVFTLIVPPSDRYIITHVGGGGGAAGYLLTSLFLKLFGIVGTVIVLIVLILLSSIFLGFPILDVLRGLKREKAEVKESAVSGEDVKEKKRSKKRRTTKKEVKLQEEPQRGVTEDREEELPTRVGGEVHPPLELLSRPREEGGFDEDWQDEKKKLEDTLLEFGVEARVERVEIGPTVRRYELEPSPGTKMSKIVGLSREIALALAAASIRIEAPIPGKPYVGIEVPNKKRRVVYLGSILSSKVFSSSVSKLTVALGEDVGGRPLVITLDELPHLLIAGSTGSGKSVYINSLIVSLLYKSGPRDVRFIMVDPKRVELTLYNGLPHLLAPVITDPKKASKGLKWAIAEMERRYDMFSGVGVRDIRGYNQYVLNEQEGEPLPYIVIIIDELADLMMTSPKEVEASICRIAQMARATGIHLVVATQRPSVNVVTGLIKANIPARIAFTLPSQTDSRTILDVSGAEKLLGKGDMLFVAPYLSKPLRVQSPYVSEKEIRKIMKFFKENYPQGEQEDLINFVNNSVNSALQEIVDADPLFAKALEILLENKKISASYLQRRLGIGYNRASRMVDNMEAMGIIGEADGAKPRRLIVQEEKLKAMLEGGGNV